MPLPPDDPAARPTGPTRPAPRGRRPTPTGRTAAALALDIAAVRDADGLTQEVALLRAAIRRLAEHGDTTVDVAVLAELRHQVAALCTALRTQHALDDRDDDTLSAELARALEALGDDLGVPR